jgi:hypothetical protein
MTLHDGFRAAPGTEATFEYSIVVPVYNEQREPSAEQRSSG